MQLYTVVSEGLLSFGQLPPMHVYNFQGPPMHHHEKGNQMMENLQFVVNLPHHSHPTPPPSPPHHKVASRSAPTKVNSTCLKRKKKVINVDDDKPHESIAHRLS